VVLSRRSVVDLHPVPRWAYYLTLEYGKVESSFMESPVKELLGRRIGFLKLVLVAALLALGINLLSTYLSNLQFVRPYLGWISLVLTVGALSWVLALTFGQRSVDYSYEAEFLFDPKEKRLVRIPNYDFSKELSEVMSAVFAENKGLEKIWVEDPLVDYQPPPLQHENNIKSGAASATRKPQPLVSGVLRRVSEDASSAHDMGHRPAGQRRSAALLREAVEYVLLDQLTFHLQAHFTESRYRTGLVTRYYRKDIPDLLLQNRVLALLSSPYEDRAIFADACKDNKPGEMIIVAWGPTGERYRLFELALPSRTRIRRTTTGELELNTPRLSIRIGVDYQGCVSNELSSDYIALLLGRDPREVEGLKLTVTFAYSVKTLALLRASGWDYYAWVDSFTARLREFLSIENYLEHTQWPSVALQSQIVANIIGTMMRPRPGTDPLSPSDDKPTE
jgi:hypothetical protein